MTALTADKSRITRGAGAIRDRLVIFTASTVYIGSLVNRLNAGGRAVAATAATGRRFAGLAVAFEGTNQSGLGVTAASEFVVIEYGRPAQCNIITAVRTNTSLGLNLFVSDDDSVAGTAVGSAGTRVVVGELLSWVDETGTSKATGWVNIRVTGTTNIAV